jgi:hypothetical protein
VRFFVQSRINGPWNAATGRKAQHVLGFFSKMADERTNNRSITFLFVEVLMMSKRKSNPVGLGCMLVILIVLALSFLASYFNI